jgi:hypothetical protein
MYAHRILRRVFSPSGFDTIVINEYAAALPRLLRMPGVLGAGIGMKVADGTIAYDVGPSIIVYVRTKKQRSKLPQRARVARTIGGIATDVIAIAPRNQRRGRANSGVSGEDLQSGEAIAVANVGLGTAGASARDTRGNHMLITAGHCLYGKAAFKRGTSVTRANSTDIIGQTHDVHFGLDCGLIALSGSHIVRSTTCSGVTLGAPVLPVVGRTLEKCGAFSGRTQAIVTSVGRVGALFPAMTLAPPEPDWDPLPLSQDGDSGSIWYDPETAASIGLHVQGSTRTHTRAEYGVATVLFDALRAFALRW